MNVPDAVPRCGWCRAQSPLAHLWSVIEYDGQLGLDVLYHTGICSTCGMPQYYRKEELSNGTINGISYYY